MTFPAFFGEQGRLGGLGLSRLAVPGFPDLVSGRRHREDIKRGVDPKARKRIPAPTESVITHYELTNAYSFPAEA